ncbi:Small GTPase superfamily, Rab type domain-containing protein [Rozella allomycis CSF55]|uniref:Ras-related protein Rab n=1 Tax=Rozella allomycis (strain CSF55) TaxID=988480 RepID=A0A075B583_ROZAC|nr:Small GTPase superfamily, Rab type domain-containing protein [Rozella allomycis CSF55]|eukprot:EPZ36843.1 Small GTPase superfamily, Rab type domain-containing protein [Rozella allomycis CSF55]
MSADSQSSHIFKILVVGDLGTGKTSIIKRYVHNVFSTHYKSTIGVDFALKVIDWEDGSIIRLQLWDIAGQERFGSMTRVYYKESVGALLVFDVTRPTTLEVVLKWKRDVDDKVRFKDGSNIPVVLIANKMDALSKSEIEAMQQRLDEFVLAHNFIAWYPTSAKENINIEESCRHLIRSVLERKVLFAGDDDKGSTVKLGARHKYLSCC